MYKAKEYFSSVEHMRTKLKEQFGLHLKPWKLMHILQHHLGMRYRKVKAISWQANSPKNLILRQQFAQSFLKLDLYEKCIINVDETWIGQTDFRRRKWCFLHQPDSVPQKKVQPRISLIAAIDTRGNAYVSAT